MRDALCGCTPALSSSACVLRAAEKARGAGNGEREKGGEEGGREAGSIGPGLVCSPGALLASLCGRSPQPQPLPPLDN